ncbi:MAG: NPCBM/NEW2 domain-containing protein, partial [Planctomycetota bacterium]
VRQIDFSRGKIVFLSDLEPESVTYTPYFGTGKALPLLTKFYALRKDKNLQSGPLQLAEKTYKKGLALHSRTRVVYRLPGRFSRFQAVAGIDNAVRPRGNVRLVIHGDDRVLLEATVTGADPPQPIDLDISGVRRITILADFGEEMDVADHLDLCEARILK